MVFEVGIGTSQNWNSEEAAQEVITKALSKISNPPKFVLVFSTIHYRENNGFQKILDKIYKNIPEKTPLVGGTIAGFMTNSGCYTRGLTVLACYSDEIDVAIAVGHNTKGNPKRCASEIVRKIDLKNTKNYSEKLLIDIISGPSIPALPVVNKINLVKSEFIGNIISNLLPFSSFLGFGVGKEEEILGLIKEKLVDYNIIGGSTTDDGKLFSSYEFFNDTILKNSLVAIAIYTQKKININGKLELKKTDIELEITKTSKDGRVIEEVENAPALDVLLSKLGLTLNSFRNLEELYRTTFYYPLVSSNNMACSTTIGAIYGKKLAIGHNINSDRIAILSASRKEILDAPKILQTTAANDLTIIFGCETSLETLGHKIYEHKKLIDTYINNKDYLILYCGGEHYGRAKERINIRTHSFNTLSISES